MACTDAHIARARRRAARRLGFYIHAMVFGVVNLALLTINLSVTPARLWAMFPLFGWGIGLLAHGLAVLGPIERLYRALVARELARIRATLDTTP